jgi:hypothetical protein
MGDMMKAIHDDIEEYEGLCRNYNERIRVSHGSPDCYGEHARSLKKRAREERDAQWEKERAQKKE